VRLASGVGFLDKRLFDSKYDDVAQTALGFVKRFVPAEPG
jgi:hypothetical protein